MSTILVRADVEIDTDDLDMDELVRDIPTSILKEELASRGVQEIGSVSEDPFKTLEAISKFLCIRPEDRKNKSKIVSAIIEL